CIKRKPRYQAVSSQRNVAGLFDHLVGELLELQGDVEAESLGSFEVDDQFELGWSLHRQVGRLLAPEDAGRAARASRLRIRWETPAGHSWPRSLRNFWGVAGFSLHFRCIRQ